MSSAPFFLLPFINGGKPALSGSGSNSPNLTVADGATLGGSGFSSAFTLGSARTSSNGTVNAVLNGTNNTGSGTLSLNDGSVNPCFIITTGGMPLSTSTVLKVNKTGE